MDKGKEDTRDSVALGAKVRQLRRWLNLTQCELAGLAGVCQAIVSHIECGWHVRPESVRRVMAALRAAQARPPGRGR